MKNFYTALIFLFTLSFSFGQNAALDFDGTNDYVEIDQSVGNFNHDQEFTVSLWVKIPSINQVEAYSTDNAILEKWSGSGPYPFVIRYMNHTAGTDAGKIKIAIFDGTSNPSYVSIMTLNDDKWHHLGLKQSGNALYLYIDGVRDNLYGITYPANTTTNNSPLYIGQRGGSLNNFKGKIDNVRIWNTALSDSLIKKDMHSDIPAIANLQAAYNFNEGTPNGNNTSISQVADINSAYPGVLYNFAKTGSSSNFTEGVSTIYVKLDAPGVNNGSSWTDAYTDLQDALSIAGKTSIIWVAKGTYKPTTTTDKSLSFVISDSVKVYGGFAGNEPANYDLNLRDFIANETILSGDIGTENVETDNTYNVIYTEGVTAATLLNGFTISKGNASESSVERTRRGGGWYNDGTLSGESHPTISHCHFKSNKAFYGGGLYNNANANGAKASPLIEFCSFSSNTAIYNAGAVYNFGEAGESSPTFADCSFSSNTAGLLGGAFYNSGYNGKSSPTFTNCSFSLNAANYAGGAVYNYGRDGESSPIFTDCSFSANTVYNNGGGAVYNFGEGGESSPTFTDCSFSSNTANHDGGAVHNKGYNGKSNPTFTGCYFSLNTASHGGAVFWAGDDGDLSSTLTNCVFNSNGVEHFYYQDGNANKQPKFMNCTFYGATTRVIRTHFDSGLTPVDFINCLFWGNNNNIVDKNSSNTSYIGDENTMVNITYSIVEEAAFTQAPYTGNNNINQNPYFKDALGGDLSLKPCSPAIDAGTNGGTSPLDILGEPRIFGCIKADMGAYEFQGLYKNTAFDLSGVGIDNSGVGTSSFYYGSPILASNKVLKPGVKTRYKAQNVIDLNPGFKAEGVQSFETEIGVETCP